jgi:hypothetical protein
MINNDIVVNTEVWVVVVLVLTGNLHEPAIGKSC